MNIRSIALSTLIFGFFSLSTIDAPTCIGETLETVPIHETGVTVPPTDSMSPANPAVAPPSDMAPGKPGDAPSDNENTLRPGPAAVVPAVIAVPIAKEMAEDSDKKPADDTPKKSDSVKDRDNQDTAKEDESQQKEEARKETPVPEFSMTYDADAQTMDAPGTITYSLVIENTGNTPLTRISISSRVPESFTGPTGDGGQAGILDVGETWTFAGEYPVTREVFDGKGVDENNARDRDNDIDSSVTVGFSETSPQKAAATVRLSQAPRFVLTQNADLSSIDEPKKISYTITIENTGSVSLTGINIAAPLLKDLDGPEGDNKNPGILDVDEIWTYKGTYTATQDIIDGNGVDAYNVIDRDGDIDSTVMVSFAEIEKPQTAYAAVATNLSITGDIFEKQHRYLHGFLSANRSYISNLYQTDTDPESCWATFLTPGVWATYPSEMQRSVEIITANASPGGLAVDTFNPTDFRNFQAYLLYSPQWEIYHDQNLKAYQDPDIGSGIIDGDDIADFTDHDSLDRLTHRVDAMLHYHSGNKLGVRALNQYKISYDAFSERAYYTDDKYKSNMFNIAGTLDATEKLQARLDYTNFRLNYDDDFNRDDDRRDNIYAAYAFFRMTAKSSVFLEYDFADIGYRESPRDSHEHRYFAGLRWEMTGKSSGQIKGGYGKKKSDDSPMVDTDVDVEEISEDNWMAAIQIDHNLSAKTNLTLNAYRRYDEVLEHRYDYGAIDNFYANYILAHFVGAKLSWKAASNVQLNLDTSYFFDDFKGSRYGNGMGIDEEREDENFSVSPSITVNLSKYFTVDGGYIYTDHESNYPTHDYFDHTFFVRASLHI